MGANLKSNDNNAYDAFFAAITNTNEVAFNLTGGANVTAETKAGNIPIHGIPFDVATTFPGIDGFNHMAEIPQSTYCVFPKRPV